MKACFQNNIINEMDEK